MFKNISVRIYVLINFLLVIVLISTILIGSQYYFSRQAALSAVEKNFSQASKSILKMINFSSKNTKRLLDLLAHNVDKRELLPTFTYALSVNRAINSVYIGYANDDYIQVINLKKVQELKHYYEIPKNARWGVVEEQEKKHLIKFLDKDLNVLTTTHLKSSFQPTTRLWYTEAMKSKNVILTHLYKFQISKEYGVSYAKKLKNQKAVIGLDFSINSINKVLKREQFHKNASVFLYDIQNNLLASSHDISLKKWQDISPYFNINKENKKENVIYRNEEYLVYHSRYSAFESKENINVGVILKKSAILKPYLENIISNIYISLFLILLSVPIILFSISRIVKPIKELMLEKKKVKERQYDSVEEIKTNIREYKELSKSLVNMAQSIKKYEDEQAKLFDAIVELIGDAIDSKSRYTGGHCERVPEIAEQLTRYVSDKKEGIFKDFSFESDEEWREFHIGAWLHDCGKVTTPEYVVDKATKLETIYNRIHEIRTRFEVLYRDAEIDYFKALREGEDEKSALKKCKEVQKKLIEDFTFIASANRGGEFMSPDKQKRIREIANQTWIRYFDNRLGISSAEVLRFEGIDAVHVPVLEKLLDDKPEHIIKRDNFDYEDYRANGFKEEVPEYLYNYGEVYNLNISKGTLSNEERFKINEHIIMSIKMLEHLPFPDGLKRVPEYAGTHHETMIGTGYPRKLKKEQLSVPSRIMAIADIFEALTASDRPYKEAKTLSESLKIMSFMVKDEHIDGDLFHLFLESKIYLKYAQVYLKPEQIDRVN